MKQQHGVALITVLIMVALASILVAAMIKHQAATTENTAYLVRKNQALLYAKSAEAFFIELLKDDANNAENVDHLHEVWAKPMPAFPIDGGYIQGQLYDQSGKFNLNCLLDEKGQVNKEAKQWFEKLLVRVGLPAQLSEAVIDWQDADDLTIGSMGAEISYYNGLNPSYQPANRLFHDVNELKRVRGFEGLNFQRIAPYIAAFNHHETQVNINTASAFLLASLYEQLDESQIQNALNKQNQQFSHFKNVDELWQLEVFQQIPNDVKVSMGKLLGVKSDYFQAKIEVVLEDRQRFLTSDFIRKDKRVYVQKRSLLFNQ